MCGIEGYKSVHNKLILNNFTAKTYPRSFFGHPIPSGVLECCGRFDWNKLYFWPHPFYGRK